MAEVVSTQGGLIFSMLMGDFNSTPGSAVYRFVRHGELDCGAEDGAIWQGSWRAQAKAGRLAIYVR